jgi:hypothetical protein
MMVLVTYTKHKRGGGGGGPGASTVTRAHAVSYIRKKLARRWPSLPPIPMPRPKYGFVQGPRLCGTE